MIIVMKQNVPEAQVKAFLAFRNSFAVHRLEINGVKWEYIAAGSGQEAFLFLHGLSGAYDIWWQQIQALRGNFRVISVTYPAVDSLEGLSDGVLAILDTRIQRMAYGKIFLESLPTYTITQNLAEVERFMQDSHV